MIHLQLVDAALSFLIAFGYAGLGNLILGRRAASLFEWCQSFIIGCAISSALLFPLSFACQGRALKITFGYVAAAALIEAVRCGKGILALWSGGFPANIERMRRAIIFAGAWWRTWRPGRFAAGAMGLITASVSIFTMLNLWLGFEWDGFQIWATKAQVLYFTGAVGPDPLPIETEYLGRLVNYPHAVPLYQAILASIHGSFDFLRLKQVFLPFYLCLLISTYRMAREILPADWALGTTALQASLPGVAVLQENVGGYADMPLACAIAMAWATCLKHDFQKWTARSPAVWALGSVLTFKSEGGHSAATRARCAGNFRMGAGERSADYRDQAPDWIVAAYWAVGGSSDRLSPLD